MTIPEVLVSASLLLLVSAILFNMLIPLMGRSVKLDEKQDNLQRAVVLRHHMLSRLKTAQILNVSDVSVEFYANDVASTPYGSINKLGNDEMLAFDTTRIWEITTETRPNGMWVVDRELGAGGTNRGIWNLGPGGSMELTVNNPFLRVDLVGSTGHLDGGTWSKAFELFLPNAPASSASVVSLAD